MKNLFYFVSSCLVLSNSGIYAQDAADCQPVEENLCENEEPRVVRFRRIQNYENSYIINPVERQPVNSHPSAHESSFYEMMTR